MHAPGSFPTNRSRLVVRISSLAGEELTLDVPLCDLRWEDHTGSTPSTHEEDLDEHDKAAPRFSVAAREIVLLFQKYAAGMQAFDSFRLAPIHFLMLMNDDPDSENEVYRCWYKTLPAPSSIKEKRKGKQDKGLLLPSQKNLDKGLDVWTSDLVPFQPKYIFAPMIFRCEIPGCGKNRILHATDANWYEENLPPPHQFRCDEIWGCSCATPSDDAEKDVKLYWISIGGRVLKEGPAGRIPEEKSPYDEGASGAAFRFVANLELKILLDAPGMAEWFRRAYLGKRSFHEVIDAVCDILPSDVPCDRSAEGQPEHGAAVQAVSAPSSRTLHCDPYFWQPLPLLGSGSSQRLKDAVRRVRDHDALEGMSEYSWTSISSIQEDVTTVLASESGKMQRDSSGRMLKAPSHGIAQVGTSS